MPKKGCSVTHIADGRKIAERKKHTGKKLNDWERVEYKTIRRDNGNSVMLTLKNGHDIWVHKHRSVILKGKKVIYIEPDYYAMDFKHVVELTAD